MKKCGRCQEKKPVAAFFKRAASFDGLQARCKLCCAKHARSPKGKTTQKEYNQSAKRKTLQKKYKQSPKGRASKKRYEQSDKGKTAKKKWQQSDKGKISSANKRHRKKIAQAAQAVRER